MAVAKRRLSPSSSFFSLKGSASSMAESLSGSSSNCSSSSSNNEFDDSGRDQIHPLYSDVIGGKNSFQEQHYHRNSIPSMTASSVEDENDSVADDSTCPGSRWDGAASTYYNNSSTNVNHYHHRASAGRSVASDPYHLPHHWGSSASPLSSSLSAHPTYQRDSGLTSPFISRNSTLVFTATKRKSPIYILVAAFCAIGMFLYDQSHATLHNALQQVVKFTEHRRKVHAKFDSIEQDIRILQRQVMELTATLEGGLPSLSEMLSGDEELDVLQAKLKEGSTQIGTLQKRLQEIHKHDAILKYGSGKIRVELELEFPSSTSSSAAAAAAAASGGGSTSLKNNKKSQSPTIVMEMAPLDMMPHSVYMFLEMVDAKLFDGCSFILNAMHVIKAAPLPYNGSSAAAKVRSFAQKGLESVAFREYSPDFPHDPYTVGFAVDGSPSFYINTQDNTDIHVGEPCFAKIISGYDTVKRMEEAPTRNGIWYRQRIGIKRATIL
jgi:cyclophilin family peptidyl-prolyl cis-trans isomerase